LEILVYTPKLTSRIRYSIRLLLTELLRVEVSFEEDEANFKASPIPFKITYGKQSIGGFPHFGGHPFLLEKGINEQSIKVSDEEGVITFFPVKDALLSFDPFAASFFLVTRYEEYLPHRRDMHNRFDVSQSLAAQNGFLQKPVVNQWAYLVRDQLQQHFPKLEFPKRQYSFTSSIDVDNAYAYLEKGIMRTLGAYTRSLLNFDVKDLARRTRALLTIDHDPYDTFDFQLAIQKKYHLRPIYFFLVADYGLNDKNVPITSRKFQSLIKRINDYADVGIHPSYGSSVEASKLKKEVQRLSDVLHMEIRKSRQHFLKISLPQTYRQLIELEITDDYTMGYATELGFRASICDPFFFYDLELETETRLKIHPFSFMEATLKYYMNVGPENAIAHLEPILKAIRAVDGTFVSLWHNDSLSGEAPWVGWKEVYERMVQLAGTEG